jgi:hypothetical protein
VTVGRVHRDPEPHDRLTRLAAAVVTAIEDHPEARDDDQVIVMLNNGPEHGLAMAGYEHFTEGSAAMIRHLQAVFAAEGKELRVVEVGQMGRDS